jgi:hypothetical protein
LARALDSVVSSAGARPFPELLYNRRPRLPNRHLSRFPHEINSGEGPPPWCLCPLGVALPSCSEAPLPRVEPRRHLSLRFTTDHRASGGFLAFRTGSGKKKCAYRGVPRFPTNLPNFFFGFFLLPWCCGYPK